MLRAHANAMYQLVGMQFRAEYPPFVSQSHCEFFKAETRDPDTFPIFLSPDDKLVAHGVLQEVWHNIHPLYFYSLQYYTRFPNAPDEVTVGDLNDINDFDTNNYFFYGQRLTAYLSVCLY